MRHCQIYLLQLQTLVDNHVNVHDDISLHFISARGVCVCICAFVILSRENCISIGNQLSTLFRKNKLRSWWKRRVYECVCNWAPPPSLHDLPIACETVSYSCILPLCVSPRCICQRIRECVSYLCHDSMMITGNWYFAFIIMRLLNLFFCLLTCIINVQFYH